MNFSGGLILMISVGILILGGIVAVNELGVESAAGNASYSANMTQTTESVAMPIFTVFGITIILIGAYVLLSAFNAI